MEDKEFYDRIGCLEKNCLDPRTGLDLDSLLDMIPALCAELSESALRRSSKNIELFLNKFETYRDTIVQSRVKKSDFELIKVIGRGAFGEVQVVRHRRTGSVYAMKTLSKCETIKRVDSAMFWEEREIMLSANSDWIVRLVFAFQDPRNLYFVMEYLPGGDVATLMSMEAVDEKMARFYTAEVTLALDVIHNLGFIHRDIKPDNMLLDSRGHLKLADFGTCMRTNKDGYVVCEMAVGTPDYISPEVLTANNASQVGVSGSNQNAGRYGRECDWWSVGIFLYEMLYNETPFYAESLVNTYANIMNHKEKLHFPELEDGEVTNEAKDLIRHFLTDKNERLGRNGAAEIKAHPFFLTNEWNWDNIRNTQAPFIPNLKSEVDTQYFDHAAEQTTAKPPESFLPSRTFVGHHLPFIGFTYNSQYKLTLGPVAANGVSPRKSLLVGGDLETKLRQESAHRVEAEAKLQQMTREIDRLNATEQQLRNDLKTSQRECNRLAIELNDVQIKFDSESEAYRKTEKRLRDLEKDKLQLSELASKSQSNASHVAELERELREARDQLHAEADSTQKLRRQVADVQRQLSTLQSSHDAAEHQLQEAEEKRQAAEKERTRLLEQLGVESAAKADALRRVDELSTANQSISNELQRVQSHESELGEALAMAKADLANLQKAAANTELEMANLKMRLDKEARRQLNLLNSPTSPSTDSLGLIVSSSSGQGSPLPHSDSGSLFDLQRRLDAEIAEHQRTEAQLSEAQRLINELSVDRTTLTQDKKQADAEVVRLSVELESIRTKMETSHAELSTMRRELDEAYRLITARKREAEEAEDKLKRANVEKQRVVEDLSKTKEILRENQAKVKDVEQQLDTERMLNQMVKSQKREAVEECEQQKRRADDLDAVRRNLLAEHESQSMELKQLRKRADADAIAKALAESQVSALRRDREDLFSQIAELKSALNDQKTRDDATILEWSTRYDEACSNIGKLQIDAENKDAEIRKLKTNLETEQAAKRATIEKLAGQLSATMGGKAAKSSTFGKTNFEAEYKRKKEECLRLQKELKEDGQKHQAEMARLQRENDLLREQLSEETQRSHRFQQELESRQADITALELRLKQMQSSSDAISLGSSSEPSSSKENSNNNTNNNSSNHLLLDEPTRHGGRVERDIHQPHHHPLAVVNNQSSSPASPQSLENSSGGDESDVVASVLSIPKSGNLKRNGWMRVYAVLTTRRLLLFESETARNEGAEPLRNIELDRFYHVRKVNQGDVCRADPENIPKIFQVMYDPTPSHQTPQHQLQQQQPMTASMSNASLATLAATAQATMSTASLMTQSSISMSGSSSSGLGDVGSSPSTGGGGQVTPASTSGDVLIYKTHQLIKMPAPRSGQEPGSCDFCHRAFGGGGITAIFSKWSVVQCKTCHSKFHKEHIDKKEDALPICKVHAGGELAQDLLIMASSPEEQSAWVDRLLKRIPKRGKPSSGTQQPPLPHASNSVSNGSSGGNVAMNQVPAVPPATAPPVRHGSNLSNVSITSASVNGNNNSLSQRPQSPPPIQGSAVFTAPLALPPSQLPYALPSSTTTPRSGRVPQQSPVPAPRKGASAVLPPQAPPSAPSTPSSSALLSPKHV